MCEIIQYKENKRICLFCNKLSLELIYEHIDILCDYVCNK